MKRKSEILLCVGMLGVLREIGCESNTPTPSPTSVTTTGNESMTNSARETVGEYIDVSGLYSRERFLPGVYHLVSVEVVGRYGSVATTGPIATEPAGHQCVTIIT